MILVVAVEQKVTRDNRPFEGVNVVGSSAETRRCDGVCDSIDGQPTLSKESNVSNSHLSISALRRPVERD